MILKELDGIMPSVGKKAFIAENAVLVGDVTMGEDLRRFCARAGDGLIKTRTNKRARDGFDDRFVIHTSVQFTNLAN